MHRVTALEPVFPGDLAAQVLQRTVEDTREATREAIREDTRLETATLASVD